MERSAGIARLGFGFAVLITASVVEGTELESPYPRWRVGVLADDLPFSRSSTGAHSASGASESQGLYIDWWRSLGRRAGREIAFVACVDNRDCLARLKDGQLDFMGPAPYLADSSILFTRPVNRRYVSAVSRSGIQVRNPPDLKGLRIALLPRVRSEREETASWAPASLTAVSNAEAQSGLSNGSFDVVLTDRAWDHGRMTTIKRTPLWFRWQHIYARAEDSESLFALDSAIDALDPSSARVAGVGPRVGADELLLPADARPAVERKALAFLARHPTVRLAASPWEPLTVMHNGQFDGLALRIVKHHVLRAGLTPVFQGGDNWPKVKQDARDGRYDGIGFILVKSTTQLSPLIYSEAMIDLPMVAVARSDAEFWAGLEDLTDQRVVADPQYGEVSILVAGDEVSRILPAKQPSLALDMVRSRTADVWLEYLPIVRHAIRSAQATDVKLAFRLGGPDGARTALHPEWAPVLPLINQSIQNTKTEDLEEIYVRWAARRPHDETSSWFWFTSALAAVISVLAVGVVVLAGSLRRETRTVRQRERALRRAQLLSGIGSVELRPPYRHVYLDGETASILGIDSGTEVQSINEHVAMFVEANRVKGTIERAKTASIPLRTDVTVKVEPPRIFTYELAPPQEVDGRGGVMTGTLRDVTDERDRQAHERGLERQVLHLQKQDAIGRLAGGIAHDFNNILAASIGYNELALLELPPKHPARKSMEHVLAASARARDLVQQILTFSRREEQAYDSLRWDACVQDTLNFMRASVPATVNFVARLSGEPVWVHGDRTQLTQVLVNLITNAVDAMNGSGTVTVSLEVVTEPPAVLSRTAASTTFARLSIMDSGPGIDSSIRHQIFDPFFTTKAPGKGTGLGLSIVDGVMRAHHGFIDVRTAPAGGACFDVLLPTTVQQVEDRPVAVVPPSGRGDGQAVLVVDDEPSLTRVYQKILERQGFQVTTMNSPTEALDVIANEPARFDIVLTDLTMPDLSGVELAKRSRQINPELAILLLTGYRADAPADSDGLFCEVLQKPLTGDELVAGVERALQARGDDITVNV